MPHLENSTQEKQAVTREYTPHYQRASKKEKKILPDEYTKWNCLLDHIKAGGIGKAMGIGNALAGEYSFINIQPFQKTGILL